MAFPFWSCRISDSGKASSWRRPLIQISCVNHLDQHLSPPAVAKLCSDRFEAKMCQRLIHALFWTNIWWNRCIRDATPVTSARNSLKRHLQWWSLLAWQAVRMTLWLNTLDTNCRRCVSSALFTPGLSGGCCCVVKFTGCPFEQETLLWVHTLVTSPFFFLE